MMAPQEYVFRRLSTPFEWGAHDCVTFACGWVLERTGADPMEHLRGTYRTALGAARVWKRLGGFDAAVSSGFAHLQEVAPNALQPGDVFLIHIADRHMCGVVSPFGLWVPGQFGVVRASGQIIKAWRP